MTWDSDEAAAPIVVRGDPDLEDLIPGYLDKRRHDVTAMREALAQGDFDTIRVLGHTMAGTGEGYGFEPLTDLGRALEQAAKASDADTIEKRLRGLAGYLERVVVVYE